MDKNWYTNKRKCMDLTIVLPESPEGSKNQKVGYSRPGSQNPCQGAEDPAALFCRSSEKQANFDGNLFIAAVCFLSPSS